MSFQHDSKWFFVPVDLNDQVRSTSRRHVLEGSNLSRVERLVREAIQNSVDATLSNQKTEVVFFNKTFRARDVDSLSRLLRLRDDDSPATRITELGLGPDNAIARLMSGETDQSVTATFIEDYNTCGLGFDAEDKKDRFVELCLAFGQDRTGAEAVRGGSYGFGKEVYEDVSDCNFFIVYSVFNPSDETEGAHARLFGCATFDGHEWNGGTYKGRALFGRILTNDGQELCRPIEDDQAHAVALELGFEARSKDDLGTSIMILGTDIDLGEVRSAIEKHWWPRFLSNQLTVDLWQGNEALDSPEPRDRPDLKPYIDCYEMIEHDIPADSSFQLKQRLRRSRGHNTGSIALTARREKDLDWPSGNDDDPLSNRVALIRSGPRMVVNYTDPRGSSRVDFAGVFVSHPDVEQALHLSEPPAHNLWDPDSQRLRDAFVNDVEVGENAKQVVRSVLSQVRRRARLFRDSLDQPPPPPQTRGTMTVARLLANLMSGRGTIPPSPPPRTPDPFEIVVQEGRSNTASTSKVTATVKLKLKDDAPLDTADVITSFTPSVVIDDNLRRDPSERLGLSSVIVNGAPANVENEFDVRVDVVKGQFTIVEAASDEFDRDLYASLVLDVQTVTDNSKETSIPTSTGEGNDDK